MTTGANTGQRPDSPTRPRNQETGYLARYTEDDHAETVSCLRRIMAGEIRVQRIRIDLARTCNLRCSYCISRMDAAAALSPGSQSIPYDLLEAVVPQVVAMGATTVNFYGGGEPLLHPRISDVLALMARNGVTVQLISNGSGLTKHVRETIRTWSRMMGIFRFSIHGLSADSFRRITGSPLFGRITADIARLVRELEGIEQRPHIGLFVPVTVAFPEPELRSFIRWASEAGVDSLWFAEDYRFPFKPESAAPCRFPQVKNAVLQIAKEHLRLPIDYTRTIAYTYARDMCYQELTNMNLVWDPNSRRLMMVRCPNYFPTGPSDYPPEGAYAFVEPAGIVRSWEEHLKSSSARQPLECSRRDRCLCYRRNERIAERLEAGKQEA